MSGTVFFKPLSIPVPVLREAKMGQYKGYLTDVQNEGGGNGRRFIDGNVSLGDILPNLLLEIYALAKKGNYWKYIDRIFYTSLVKITPNVC